MSSQDDRPRSPFPSQRQSEQSSIENVEKSETSHNGQLGQHQQKQDDVPPDGGYGWVCVASSYGVFLAYYLSHNVFPGATYLDFAFVGGLSISMALLISPIATTLIGHAGTRVCLLVGIFFETLSLIGASFAKQTWQLFLSQGVCFGWGMGFLFVGSVNVPPQWFAKRRSLANACGAAGSGLGGLTYALATQAIIEHISLGWAFRVLGILSFAVNFTCTIMIRDRNKQIGTKHVAFSSSLMKQPHFLLLLGWGFFSMLGYIVLLFSLPNYATQSAGLTASQGSLVSAMLNLGQGLGRPPVGYFSDRVGRINMAMTCTFACGLFCLVIWVFASSYGVLIFFALIAGTVSGTFWATVAPVTAECVGLRDLPSALNLTWLNLVLPTTFSEAMALEIASKSQAGYLGAQLFAGFMYVAAAGCLVGVRMWRIGVVEKGQGREASLMARIVGWKKV
ncbi:MAG: hypothetical protein Q9162_003655 [Coniocarpon cinnabarinum]